MVCGADPRVNDALRNRIARHEAEYDRCTAALERARVEAGDRVTIDPAKITAFSGLLGEVLNSLSVVR